MKKILYFNLKFCPYCIKANLWLNELIKENPQYQTLVIEKVDEGKHPEIASQYDYYYVPTFYVDGIKIHEGIATKEKIKAVLETALTS